MDKTQARSHIASLTVDERIRFIALLANQLTIVARDTYSDNQHGVETPDRLRRINEVQHAILGILIDILDSQDGSRILDITDICFEERGDARLTQLLVFALQQSLSAT